MPMTNADADAVARAWDKIKTIGTLSDGLAQYNAAQARFYIASLYDVGLLEQHQFDAVIAANVTALKDCETHHAGMNADGLLND